MGLARAGQAVWIDSDPACGHAKTDDVDDCWALLLGLRSNELEIRGISTLFGNGSGTFKVYEAKNALYLSGFVIFTNDKFQEFTFFMQAVNLVSPHH